MTIIGIGTDIVDIRRIRAAKDLARTAEFILTKPEIVEMKKSRDQAQFLAARLAIKESVIKAYPGKLGYADVETGKKGTKVVVSLIPAKSCVKKKLILIHVSVAHEKEYAIGYAILSA